MSHTDTEQTVAVEDVKKGEYVKRVLKDGRIGGKVFIRDGYEPSTKRYRLIDAEDVNREVFVAKGATLFVGFSY